MVIGGGVSTFYFEGAPTGVTAALEDLYSAWGSWLPTGGGVTIPNTGDTLDSGSGVLNGIWTDGTATGAGFSGSPEHAAGVGARVTWTTDGITNGRRVRGTTFIVPLIRSAYDTDGTLTDGAKNALQDAADTFFGAVGDIMRIWSRPVGGSGGSLSGVTGAIVPDTVSWLRSRRT